MQTKEEQLKNLKKTFKNSGGSTKNMTTSLRKLKNVLLKTNSDINLKYNHTYQLKYYVQDNKFMVKKVRYIGKDSKGRKQFIELVKIEAPINAGFKAFIPMITILEEQKYEIKYTT